MKTIVEFHGYRCTVRRSHYTTNPDRVALFLVGTGEFEGEPMATCTCNLPDEPLADGEVLIKSWSENEGMADALQQNGVIGPPLREVAAGFCVATVHKLT